jgi:uncharacterized protein
MATDRICRRGALGWLAAGAAAWSGSALAAPSRSPRRRLYLSAKARDDGACFFSAFDGEHGERFVVPLPARGHAVALHPLRREAVIFGRRPGRFALAVDLRTGTVLAELANEPDRRFNGHGAFSADGALLFATESDHAAGIGVVGVYDAADRYRPLGAFPSGGLDPHEIRLLADGRTLVLANGGILTDPEVEGVKLNLDRMQSSLAYIDARAGTLLREARLPPSLHQLSLRHLALARAGVVVAMQYEGAPSDLVPLVAVDSEGSGLVPLVLPETGVRRLKNYCGSAAVDSSKRYMAVSSPRGSTIAFWDLEEGRLAGLADLPDGCGLAPCGGAGAFLATSGLGEVVRLDAVDGSTTPAAAGLDPTDHWDNHLALAWV